jgi:hypothetical protein
MTEQGPEAARVCIHVEDHTGNKQRDARIRSDAPVSQLMPALLAAMKLPVTDPSGRPVTYHLAFGGRQLQEEDTLESAEVVEGATITIVPEMTAGSEDAADDASR